MHQFFPAVSQTPYIIAPCRDADFEQVKHYVAELELDDRCMKMEEFIIATGDKGLAGFGRVREYAGFSEMCTLGVLPGEQLKGLGKELTRHMIKKALGPIYLVCIIPAFFEEFGFSICREFPPEIQDKLNYCMDSLAVPEPYVVMKQH